MRIGVAILACALFASKVAFAGPPASSATATPSFDCAKAATPVEHLTCNSPDLSRLDAALADAFRASREHQSEEDRAASLQSQRQWLQLRFETCGIPTGGDIDPVKAADATSCLSKLYDARIATLQAGPAQPPALASADVDQAAGFDTSLFAATGTHEAILTVSVFGRYTIEVKSDQGTAIQLVDRMAGPGNVEGSAGHADGRIDAFLDHGRYKVKLFADPHGAGDAQLSVTPSVEQETTAQQLVELKPVDADLADHQQRSYWLNVTAARPVAIEASGRYLDDLRLWRDGKWLVDATPTSHVADPGVGQPLTVKQLSTTLMPGLYRLTAYGGQGQKWAKGGDAKPLHIHFGIPSLAESGRTHLVAPATGVDRFIIPASATYFRLDIDHAEHAAISVQPYDAQNPFDSGSNRATIDKTSRDPFAEVFATQGGAGTFKIVTVERQSGLPYTLTWFDDRQQRTELAVRAGDTGWLSLYNSGNDIDQLDPTVVVIDPKDHAIASTALKVGAATAWKRHFNLLAESSLLLEATEPVDLLVEGQGADAEYRIEPLINHERSRGVPDEPSGYAWKIDPGFYRLDIRPRPDGKGVLSLSLHGKTVQAAASDAPHQAAAMLPMSFPLTGTYTIVANQQADVHGGLRVYRSPIDILPGISFEMAGDQTLTLPVTAAKDGSVSAVAEDGTVLPLAIDNGQAGALQTLSHGRHDITLVMPAGDPRYVAINFTPSDLRDAAPLPVIDARTLAGIPQFPVLTIDKPAYPNLAAQGSASFALPVTNPALYRLESTGIIETEGDLRTRVIPELDKESANGIGRNFLVQRYLDEGDYQLTVSPSGASAGPVGVKVSETTLVDLGPLTPELVARTTLPPSQAGVYRFHIDTAGKYSLKTLGLGHDFAMRLEDADGWPLLPPGDIADVTYDFPAGDYRMVLLPGAVENRAVTTLHRIEKPVERSGHGPFALALGTAGQNRWLEPAKGEVRAPDLWNFTLGAAANVTISIDSGMQAALAGKDVRTAQPGKDWTGLLPAGDYQLAVTSVAPNSRVDYTLNVTSKELITGERRNITAPADIPVSIGSGPPVEINSYGAADVRGTLIDADGQIAAANDDRDNDWNFSIASSLQPGQYTLHVEPVGAPSATSEIAIEQPAETQDTAATMGKQAMIADALVHVVPIDEAALKPNSLLVVQADSASPVGIALEGSREGNPWQIVGEQTGINPFMGLPVGEKPPALRLRIWSRDHTATPIKYTVVDPEPKTVDEGALIKGADLQPVTMADKTLGALHVARKSRQILFLDGPAPALQWGVQAQSYLPTATTHEASGQIGGEGNDIWLLDRNDHETVKLRVPDLQGGSVKFTVPARGHGIAIDAAAVPDGAMVLWKVNARGAGQAAVSANPWDARLLAFGGPQNARVGITVGLAGSKGVRLWQPEDATRTPDLPVTLSRYEFKLPEAHPLASEVTDGAFAGHDAARFVLPDGNKALSLNLPTGAAAILTVKNEPVSVIWAASSTIFEIPTQADGLTLLYTGAGHAAYSIGLDLSGSSSNWARHDTPGTLVLDYYAGLLLDRAYALGAVSGMTVVGDLGTGIQRGLTADIGGHQPIHALIEFQPGLMDYAQHLDHDLADTAKTVSPQTGKPESMPAQSVRINAGPARLIRARVDVPAILYQGVPDDQDIHPQLLDAGTDYFLLMPEGQSRDLMVMPVDPEGKGIMTLSALTTTPISEGIGPKRRIAPGEARAFSFSLEQPRTVGVGVRASVDIANCYVVGPDGKQQGGNGKLVTASLPAGPSVMVVEVPANGEPVEIEPALVGSVQPDTGPPDDVKAEYLAMVNGKNKP